MPIFDSEKIPFSFVQVMFRLERMGLSPLERQFGEVDAAYLLRTKEAFPGVFDDMVVPEKRRARH
jgi:hypothetical protein